MFIIGEKIKKQSVIYPEDVPTAIEVSSDVYVSMLGIRYATMNIQAKLTSAKTAVCQLTCASDASGTGKADVSGKTLTLTGGTSSIGCIDFEINDLALDSDKYFVGVDVTTNQNGDNISAWVEWIAPYQHGSLNPN